MADITKDPRYIHRPFDPSRWRYYLVDSDVHRATGDFVLLNKDEVPKESWLGRISIRLPAGSDANGDEMSYGGFYGLPEIRATPRIKVGVRNKPLDAYTGVQSFISSRAKALLESVDAEAFDFVECETVARRGVEVEPYWMMGVKRVAMTFDEDRSDVVVGDWLDTPSGRTFATIWTINDFYPAPDMPREWHAFWLFRKGIHFIFDQMIVDRWRAEKLTGWCFSPLQPPNKQEAQACLSFGNPEYYWNIRLDHTGQPRQPSA